MDRTTQQILVDEHIRGLRLEAEAGRLVAHARTASKARATVREDRAGLSFGFLRRLVGRLVAA